MKNDPYSLISYFYDAFALLVLSVFRERTRDLALRKFAALPTVKILEVAGGTGSQAKYLSEAGFEVTALDRSPGMLRQAKKKAQGGGKPIFKIVRGDAAALPFESAAFHAAVIQLALHEMPKEVREASVREMKRVTKENALLIFVDYLRSPRLNFTSPFLWLAELGAGLNHFANAREFVKEGGLPRLLDRHGLEARASQSFFQGHVSLTEARKKAST